MNSSISITFGVGLRKKHPTLDVIEPKQNVTNSQ